MNLLRCHIHGFGRLADVSLQFERGLNIVFAGNEAGKTTLQRFLVAMLYGQLRSDLKTHRRMDAWVSQYKPWHSSEYGGILWCCLAGARELELRRSFGKEDASFQIRTFAGEDITNQYEQQRNGDVLFARSHLGLPKELFDSVATIRENRLAELNGRDSIRDRIANLAQSGDEELSVRQSLAKLEEALEYIGSERAPTRPYKQSLDLVQALKIERSDLQKRREEFQTWVDERARVAAEASRLERESNLAAQTVLTARLRETAAKVHTLEEIDHEIEVLTREIEAAHGDPSFPAYGLDNLNQLVAVRESIEKQLSDIRKDINRTADVVARAEKDRKSLLQYGELDASVESEKRITDWFVGYLSLSVQKDEAQRNLGALNEDLAALNRTLEAYPAFGRSDMDWEKKAREAADEERHAAQRSAELAAGITERRGSLADAKRKVRRSRAAAVVAILIFCAAVGLRLTLPSATLPWAADLTIALLGAAAAALCWTIASRQQRSVREVQTGMEQLETERARLREQGGSAQSTIRQAMSESGFTTIEAFLAEARKYDLIRHRISDSSARACEARDQRDRIDAECLEVYARLKDSLAKVGLACSPGNLKTQIDVLRSNLRRYREIASRCHDLNDRLNALRAKEQGIVEEAAGKDARIRDILAEGGVDSPEAYRDACRRRQRTLELLDKKASRTREYQRLRGTLTLKEWKTQLQLLVQQDSEQRSEQKAAPEPAASRRPDDTPGAMPLLPYCLTLEEAEQEEKRLASLLAAARHEHVRLCERVSNAFHNCREMSEIDEDLAMAEQSLQEHRTNREALSRALEALQAISREQQETLAPQLNRAVELRFLRLCQGRYEEVKIDPDLRMLVRESGTAELRNVEQLSHGTQDQIYFALRFGILDLVAGDEESCPCFLDEPFSAYDRTRMTEALKILHDEAEHRQLMLFTCREDLLELAGASGHAAVIRL